LEFAQILLFSLFFITIILRIWELRIAKLNRILKSNQVQSEHYKEKYFFVFFVLHVGFLGITPLEVILWDRPFYPILGGVAFFIYLFCLILRFHILKILGTHWNTEILVSLEPESIVTEGIYSRIRHPNYLVVILEIFSLSLFHSAWFSMVFFSLFNLILLLKFRIPREEEFLFQNPKYKLHFQDKNRFFPF
jgi:methyltransferase